MRVEILDSVLPVAEVMAAMRAGADGAVCCFDGIVRNNTRGRETLYLDYEAKRSMALAQMEALAAEAVTRFGVRDVALLHRLGRLAVGETSVLIVVASAHRGAAFDACRWLIDTLKKQVPIWKKETFVDGVIWADGEAFPSDVALNRESKATRAMADGEAFPSDVALNGESKTTRAMTDGAAFPAGVALNGEAKAIRGMADGEAFPADVALDAKG